ncbi:MAG: response regulator [Mesorhizobium sp.]|uniref:response regulator transcription factor n=1 Tax=unclassified Mesorhizobium TaxID=325217 RepID=UPI000FCC6AAB|nr:MULTISPECIES: response regulator [unclassified Mesorhizobium]RUV69743.1 response regulator [Mesorhizobium sp. M5C.F.Cr.IN.023.01.1.1]RWF87569.1 MAG: response regulator [Mesorhizobium sp.]RWF92209.1 MAG: response regulator [Mesorhizobium sp.]RWI42303.1 MAG: response regulator [Mesorhizobium sp.]RWI48747.1 MAG: response regulator [Mesorhizobium sp.]
MSKIPTIAIVDDDEGVRASLASLVRSLGYDVRSYSSALEFLDDKIADDPGCMITDIQMPGMSGDELQTELMARGRIFPMIFMTAYPSEATRIRVMSAGAHAFLDKPVHADAIADCLKQVSRN